MGFVRSIAVVLAFGGLAGQAAASSVDVVPDCATLDQSLVKPDGSVLSVGGWSSKCEYLSGYVPRTISLVQVKADGSVDEGFSEGGIRVIPQGAGEVPVSLMPAGGGKTVLVTDSGLVRLNGDGSLDAGFGSSGQVTGIPADHFATDRITAAAIQDDGKIVVAAGSSHFGIDVARFTTDGSLDDSFGGDGVVKPEVPYPVAFEALTQLGIDSQDRIILGGSNVFGASAMRFLPDGTPDPDFGPGHNGFTGPENYDGLPSAGGFLSFSAMKVNDDGSFQLLGSVERQLYLWSNVGFAFDVDGIPQGEFPMSEANGSGVFGLMPDGGFASTVFPGRGDTSHFNLFREGGFSRGFFKLSPGSSQTRAITYSLDDNSLIATGVAEGYDCVQRCVERRFMVMSKVDAETGQPVLGFGDGGSVLIRGNECSFGVGPRVFAISPWERCRLKPPGLKARISFRHSAGRRPALAGTVDLTGPQAKPAFLGSRLEVTLPRRLRLRTARIAKSKLYVKVNGDNAIERRVSPDGRTIVIDVQQDSSGYYDPLYGEDPPANGDTGIRFGLKRGVLKKIPRSLRRVPLNFRIKGTYSLLGEQVELTSPSSQWFASNVTFRVKRVKPVKRSRTAGQRLSSSSR